MRKYGLKNSKTFALLIIVTLSLLSTAVVNAQYLSEADARSKAAREKNAFNQSKIDAVVGKTFWYRPGNSNSFRTEFYENARPFSAGTMVNFTGRFYLTNETSFKVIAADLKMLKIEFEDGKIAYLQAHLLADHADYPLIKDLYPGRQIASSSRSYIYPDTPFKIDNPIPFLALDSIIGKKFWYLPNASAIEKLNFTSEVRAEAPFTIDSYTITSNDVNIKLKFEDNTIGILKIGKPTIQNFSSTDIPFIYISKEKYVPTREYLYAGPPREVIAAEETAFAARVAAEEAAIAAIAAATLRDKAAAAEERSRAKKEAIVLLTKELKGLLKSFEVRGMSLGGDYYHDISESRGFASGKGSQVEGFPDTRREVSSDGGTLFFYRNILFMSVYSDLQDNIEIRAAMNQLEAKFKSKFTAVPNQKSRVGNSETITTGFRMSIGNFGIAEVKLSVSSPIDKRICISEIAREMRQRIELRLRNYESLDERVENECKPKLNPAEIIFINRPIETLVNSRANTERVKSARQEAEERLKAANEKVKKF